MWDDCHSMTWQVVPCPHLGSEPANPRPQKQELVNLTTAPSGQPPIVFFKMVNFTLCKLYLSKKNVKRKDLLQSPWGVQIGVRGENLTLFCWWLCWRWLSSSLREASAGIKPFLSSPLQHVVSGLYHFCLHHGTKEFWQLERNLESLVQLSHLSGEETRPRQ